MEGKSSAPAFADEEEVKADLIKDSPVSQDTVNEVHEKGLLTRKKSVTFAEGTKEENSSRKRRQPPRKRDQSSSQGPLVFRMIGSILY